MKNLLENHNRKMSPGCVCKDCLKRKTIIIRPRFLMNYKLNKQG